MPEFTPQGPMRPQTWLSSTTEMTAPQCSGTTKVDPEIEEKSVSNRRQDRIADPLGCKRGVSLRESALAHPPRVKT